MTHARQADENGTVIYAPPPPPFFSRVVVLKKKEGEEPYATVVCRASGAEERRRIESLGGSVSNGRVEGEIEPSRGFADFKLKVRLKFYFCFFFLKISYIWERSQARLNLIRTRVNFVQ